MRQITTVVFVVVFVVVVVVVVVVHIKKTSLCVITLIRAFSCIMFAGKEFHKGEILFE